MPKSRIAAIVVLIGGLAVMLGTALPWTPSGGPLFLVAMNGLSQSEGAATVGVGLALAIVGADALRRGGSSPVWAIGVVAGVLAILTLAGRFGWSGYPSVAEFLEWGPAYGVYVSTLGGILGVIGSLGLRRPNRVGRLTM